ncbi:hypothetical protein OG389_04890 [Streptomyces sp. NBC_00435]
MLVVTFRRAIRDLAGLIDDELLVDADAGLACCTYRVRWWQTGNPIQ